MHNLAGFSTGEGDHQSCPREGAQGLELAALTLTFPISPFLCLHCPAPVSISIGDLVIKLLVTFGPFQRYGMSQALPAGAHCPLYSLARFVPPIIAAP